MSHYGTPPELCCIIWRRLDVEKSISGGKYKHLMWALYLLKVYGTKEQHASVSGGGGMKKPFESGRFSLSRLSLFWNHLDYGGSVLSVRPQQHIFRLASARKNWITPCKQRSSGHGNLRCSGGHQCSV
jgi:hypothetical protein